MPLKRFELLPGKIRKETGRYPEATFAEKCNLSARAHWVTGLAPKKENWENKNYAAKISSPGRYPEGPGRVSGSEPGRFF